MIAAAVQVLPNSLKRYKHLYAENFMLLSEFQSIVFPTLYETDDNVLLGGIGGSGKTTCAEFSILRNYEEGPSLVVYLNPVKTDVEEVTHEWEEKFNKKLGLQVVQILDDVLNSQEFDSCDILISTPKIFSKIVGPKIFKKIGLLIIDNIHLIQEDPQLEIFISRLRFLEKLWEHKPRIVAITSYVRDPEIVGKWIGAPPHCIFNFCMEGRRVPLHFSVIEFPEEEDKLEVVTRGTFYSISLYSHRGTYITVYVPSPKAASRLAVNLIAMGRDMEKNQTIFLIRPWEEWKEIWEEISDFTLRSTLRQGIALLHEGLDDKDRLYAVRIWEANFVQVLIKTKTMCWMDTAKADMVIVTDPQYFDSVEYAKLDLLRMTATAGRPIEDLACLIVVCPVGLEKHYYQQVQNPLQLQSRLSNFDFHRTLVEAIVKEETSDDRRLEELFKCTFVHASQDASTEYTQLLKRVGQLLVHDLYANDYIDIKDHKFRALDLGVLASQHDICYDTMELFKAKLAPTTTLQELLEILTSAVEFDKLPIRFGEGLEIRKLLRQLRFPIQQTKYKFTDGKIRAYVLLQAHFSKLPLKGYLSDDQKYVVSTSCSLVNFIIDLMTNIKGWAELSHLARTLLQMLENAGWDDQDMLVKVQRQTTVPDIE